MLRSWLTSREMKYSFSLTSSMAKSLLHNVNGAKRDNRLFLSEGSSKPQRERSLETLTSKMIFTKPSQNDNLLRRFSRNRPGTIVSKTIFVKLHSFKNLIFTKLSPFYILRQFLGTVVEGVSQKTIFLVVRVP